MNLNSNSYRSTISISYANDQMGSSCCNVTSNYIGEYEEHRNSESPGTEIRGHDDLITQCSAESSISERRLVHSVDLQHWVAGPPDFDLPAREVGSGKRRKVLEGAVADPAGGCDRGKAAVIDAPDLGADAAASGGEVDGICERRGGRGLTRSGALGGIYKDLLCEPASEDSICEPAPSTVIAIYHEACKQSRNGEKIEQGASVEDFQSAQGASAVHFVPDRHRLPTAPDPILAAITPVVPASNPATRLHAWATYRNLHRTQITHLLRLLEPDYLDLFLYATKVKCGRRCQ